MGEIETGFRKPRFPIVTGLLLFGNLVGFIVELKQGSALPDFLNTYAFVPSQTLAYVHDAAGTSFSRSVLPVFYTLFFHAGFLHLLINTFYLWLVGDVMEIFLGRVRFIVLCAAGAIVWASVALVSIPAPYSGIPALGSGGTIAILLGAYLGTYRHLLKALHRTTSRRKLVLVGTPIAVAALAWFPLQLLCGYTPLARSLDTEFGAAWWAIGASFALGVILVQLLVPAAPTGAEAVATPTMPLEEHKPAEAGAMGSCCRSTEHTGPAG